MAIKKNDAVTASFHFLNRTRHEGGKTFEVPFSEEEFASLFTALKNKPPLDPDDEVALDRVRARLDAPMDEVELVDERKIFGRFQGSYWGHSYKNTEKGDISAESVSLRPFCFLIYLSKSGRIYIGAQYLRLFGGYAALERTIRELMPNKFTVHSNALRLSSVHYKDVKPKEVRVTLLDKSEKIAQKNKITNKSILVLKKESKFDGFEESVAGQIMPHVGGSVPSVRKAIAAVLNDSSILSISESDIEDCTVIGEVNGQRRVIYMIEAGNFATRFPLAAKLDDSGHPIQLEAKLAMIKVLEDEIIARGGNV